MKRFLRLSLFILLLVITFNLKVVASTPDAIMIVTNPGEDMSSQINISWHTDTAGTYVQYTKANDNDFENALTKSGVCTPVPFDGKTSTLQCRASLTNLDSDTNYIYRVGAFNFSDTYRFRTAGNSPFSFIHVTDIHAYNPIQSRVDKANALINKLTQVGENVRFTLISGDATAYGTVYEQWDSLLKMDTVKEMMYTVTPGNHDYYNTSAKPTEIKYFNSIFNNPNNGATGVAGSFYFKYNNALFISVDSEASASSPTLLANQQNWFRNVVENNPADFIIVYTHRPFYTGDGLNAGQASDSRSWWQSIFDEYGVDLVLAGHNHVYARTHPVYNNQVLTNTNTDGTIYVTGFQIGDRYIKDTDTPMPQVAFSQIGVTSSGSTFDAGVLFTVSNNAINLQFITSTGTVLDSYQINSKSSTLNKTQFYNSVKLTSDSNDFSKATLEHIDPGIGRINKIEVVGQNNVILKTIKNPANVTSTEITNIPIDVAQYGVDVKMTFRSGETMTKKYNLSNPKLDYGEINNFSFENINNEIYLLWSSKIISGRLSKLQLFNNNELYKEAQPNDIYFILDDIKPYLVNELEFRALNMDGDVVFAKELTYGENVYIAYDYTNLTLTAGNKITPNYIVLPSYQLAFTFHSDNPEIAIVNDVGEITAISPGTATITMSLSDNPEINCTIEINVNPSDDPQDPPIPNDPPTPNDPKDEPKKGCLKASTIFYLGLFGIIILFKKRRIF